MVPQEGKYATSLSGGLDSTLLASTIQKFESNNNHRLYSVVYENASYKDRNYLY